MHYPENSSPKEKMKLRGSSVGKIPWTNERREAQRIRMLNKPNPNFVKYTKTDRLFSEETKIKIGNSSKEFYSDRTKHPRWIEDRTKLVKRQERNDSSYKEWRKSVRDRDGWICKMLNGDCLGKVIAHHILSWSKFPELRYEVNNGITLCRFHHPRKREDEIKLSPYFQNLVENNSK